MLIALSVLDLKFSGFHKDIKTANIMVMDEFEDEYILCDFGCTELKKAKTKELNETNAETLVSIGIRINKYD